MIIHWHATDDIQMLCLLLQIPSQQLVCVWGIDRKIKCAKATISGLCSILSSPRPNESWPYPLWRLGTQPHKAQWYPPSNISSISFSDVERNIEGFDVTKRFHVYQLSLVNLKRDRFDIQSFLLTQLINKVFGEFLDELISETWLFFRWLFQILICRLMIL